MAELGKYCFRQTHQSSAGARGHPGHVRTEGGRWKIGNIWENRDEIAIYGRNQGGWGYYNALVSSIFDGFYVFVS